MRHPSRSPSRRRKWLAVGVLTFVLWGVALRAAEVKPLPVSVHDSMPQARSQTVGIVVTNQAAEPGRAGRIPSKDHSARQAEAGRNESAPAKMMKPADGRPRNWSQAVPAFWVGHLDGLMERWNRLTRGKVQTVGVSAGGRPLHLITYGELEALPQEANGSSASEGRHFATRRDKARRDKPVLLWLGAVHGAEVEGLTGLVNLIQVMETGVDLRGREQPTLRALGERCRLLILPCANPDGLARFQPRWTYGMDPATARYWSHGTSDDSGAQESPDPGHLRGGIAPSQSFRGCHFNDAGVDPMQDEFFGRLSSEVGAVLQIARDEAPDWAVSLHHTLYGPEVLRPAYVPIEVQTAVGGLARRYVQRLARADLPYVPPFEPGPDGGDPPPALDLVALLYHASGATAFKFVCPCGVEAPGATRVTPEQILDIHLLLQEALMEHALQLKSDSAASGPRRPANALPTSARD